MKFSFPFLLFLAITGLQTPVQAQRFSLGSAQRFAVLSGSTVTNNGFTHISGDVGVNPGTAVTGFPPGIVMSPGAIYAGDAVAQQAQSDAATSYAVLAGMTPTQDLSGQDLGGQTLLPGVYHFTSVAQLTGILTLNNQGASNALFVFQVGSTLTTASNASVVMSGGGTGSNVFWQVGSSATLGTMSDFTGTIIADQSVTVNAGASLSSGRILARNGAATMDTNQISVPTSAPMAGAAGTFGPAEVGAPEPASLLLVGMGLPMGAVVTLHRLRRRRQYPV